MSLDEIAVEQLPDHPHDLAVGLARDGGQPLRGRGLGVLHAEDEREPGRSAAGAQCQSYLVLDTGGVREIEAALEFGAAIAIDLGVASGGVYIKAGFYFHFATDCVKFEGYVEIGGRLSVLGLISVSLTFNLSLDYERIELGAKADGSPSAVSRLFGQASLVVEIEILFFSTSVSVTVEKTFAGSESDPLFIDFIPDDATWREYCAAFG